MCSVGLLLTKNGVPCGTHGKRQKLGLDVRTRHILHTEGKDHTVQHLHLSRKSYVQKVAEGSEMSRSISESLLRQPPLSCSVSLASVMGVKGGLGQESEACSELPAFKPVWRSGTASTGQLPMISTQSSFRQSSHGLRSTRDIMAETIASMQDAVQNESLHDLERSSKWGFKRRPDGGFWMK
eukprot:TRINITY_DN38507_c0_g1_i1.p1 TRINITY_DN38507_c0_g1~~TRINITY_DN38507_c0_g1_i1.p1  ORF type:complete len:182 (+),score=18.72 TRINITY_DN38507_c0_g1_i1:39-584(+)